MMREIKMLLIMLGTASLHLCSAQNQRHTIDSLIQVLSATKEDTLKVNTLNTLGKALIDTNPDTSIILANQALLLSEKSKSKKHLADSYEVIAAANSAIGNYTSSLENNLKTLSIREELNDKSGTAKSLHNIGSIYWNQGNYPKALDYSFKALKTQEELGNNNEIANTLNNIGLIYYEKGDYSKALDYYFKVLKMDEDAGNQRGISIGLGNIGLVYSNQGDHNKALDYYFKALKLSEQLGNKYLMAAHLGNIGLAYYRKGDNSQVLDYYLKALVIDEQLGNKTGIARHLGNIGHVYYNQSDYPKALNYYFKALELSAEIGVGKGIAIHFGNIGRVYTETGKFVKAEEYLKKAIVIFDSIGAKEELWRHEKSLSLLYDNNGKYKLALEHYQKAMVLKDTIYNQEKNKEITRKEMNYEFEKTQAEEKAGHEKQLAVAEVEIKKQKILKFSFIGGLALTILLFIVGYRSYRTRQVLRLQTIRNRIADDLHDDIGSTLNSISVYSEVAKQKSPVVVEELEQIGEASRKIVDAMSDIVWTINTKNDSFEQIILRLRSLTYNLLRAKNIEHTFRADESLNDMKLSMEARRNFYLIVKEVLNNLVKYSSASRATISLTHVDNLITLTIHDNGTGFDVKQTFAGNGLISMKSRAKEMNADLKIESSPGIGTNVELKLRS